MVKYHGDNASLPNCTVILMYRQVPHPIQAMGTFLMLHKTPQKWGQLLEKSYTDILKPEILGSKAEMVTKSAICLYILCLLLLILESNYQKHSG